MIIETIIIGSGLAAAGSYIFSAWRCSSRQIDNAKPVSPVVQLVTELLQAHKGWTSHSSLYTICLKHQELGIALTLREWLYDSSIDVYLHIEDAEGVSKKVVLDTHEEAVLAKAVKNYKSSETNIERDNLARVLAERIVANPVLGGPGVSELASSSDDDSVERLDSVPSSMVLTTSGKLSNEDRQAIINRMKAERS